jgi:hypothetical protein
MINQLKEGLVVCGLLEAIQKDPELFKPLFVHSDLFTVTSEEFLEELQVVYSERQVEKMAEETTFKHFCDLVEHLYHIGKYIKTLQGLYTVSFHNLSSNFVFITSNKFKNIIIKSLTKYSFDNSLKLVILYQSMKKKYIQCHPGL